MGSRPPPAEILNADFSNAELPERFAFDVSSNQQSEFSNQHFQPESPGPRTIEVGHRAAQWQA